MKNLTNNEFKTIAQEALKNEFGFAPTKKQIILLEFNGDGTYILFAVGTKVYDYNAMHADITLEKQDWEHKH